MTCGDSTRRRPPLKTAAVLVLVPTTRRCCVLGWLDTAAGAAPKKHDKERGQLWTSDDRSTRADGGAAKKMVAKPDDAVIDWVAASGSFSRSSR